MSEVANAWRSAARTDTGKVRARNEDAFLALPEQGLWVVADGMGGHSCGEVAAQICVSAIKSFFEDEELTEKLRGIYQEQRKRNPNGSLPSAFAEFRLQRAVESANRSIFNTAQRFDSHKDMGTTVVAVSFSKSRVYIAHVGDSRVYRIRGRRIEQMTEDHSLANEYVRLNILRKEDVRHFPYRNVIVRALGLGDRVKVDTCYRSSRANDVYLLCSDGLSDLVTEEEMLSLFRQSEA